MKTNPPRWLVDFESFTAIADELEDLAKLTQKPGDAGLLSRAKAATELAQTLVVSDERERLALRAVLDAVSSWLERRTGSNRDIPGRFVEAAEIVRRNGTHIIGSLTEEERYLAWLYQLYALRRRAPRSMLLEKGFSKDFGLEWNTLDDWARSARDSGLVDMKQSTGAERGYTLTASGAAHVERVLAELEATDAPRAERQLEKKFKILDDWDHYGPDLVGCAGNFGPSALFIDIDHFKAYNTKYTNVRVDAGILGPLQVFLRECARGNGYAYRHGGEEFVLLLANASHAIALAIAEEILHGTRNLPLRVGDETVKITISIGVAASERWAVRDELLGKANQAQIDAKSQGRDRVVSA